MVPPQDSPTFQAVSSATPNSSVFGLPLSITSIASVTTAPSTQPPDTEPRKLPSLVDHQIGADRPRRRAPGLDHGRERHAAARLAPVLGGFEDVFVAREHDRASMSSSADPWIEAAHPQIMSRDLVSHAFGSPPPPGRQRAAPAPSIDSRLWIGRNSSTCGSIARMPLGLGLEAVEPQQRVEPDQPPAGAVQPVHLEAEPCRRRRARARR